jgi:hypothetical protein
MAYGDSADSLEKRHSAIAAVRLADAVPEQIRIYFEKRQERIPVRVVRIPVPHAR